MKLGEIKPFVYEDGITGDTVEVRTSAVYSAVLRINETDYYFAKGTGQLLEADELEVAEDGRVPSASELAKIKPFVLNDVMLGREIGLRVSPLYTTLSINDRDYYFIRETGEFDGTGMAVAQ